jgi:D-alanine-D-alanine ligase
MTRHVVVLAGGLSHERDVSLRSGSRLHEALRGSGLDVTLRDTDAELIPWLAEAKPDAAIITLHGSRGENGAIQGILEMSGVPYLGTTSKNCRLAYEKNIAKNLVQRAGFTTPAWMSLSHSTFRDLGAQPLISLLVGHLGLPLMVKPQHGGSALGATAVRTVEELPASLVNAFAYGEIVVVEQFVDGVELAITVLEDENGVVTALPAVEISPASGIFDYESRYTAGLTTYFTPARLPDEVAAAAADLAIGAHRAIGLRDLSRTDAIATEDGVVHFLEVNVSPGLTETSMLPMSVAEAGLDLGAVYAEMVEHAILRSH